MDSNFNSLLALQIPANPQRCHYVKATVQARRYANATAALFHGLRGLAYFTRVSGIFVVTWFDMERKGWMD